MSRQPGLGTNTQVGGGIGCRNTTEKFSLQTARKAEWVQMSVIGWGDTVEGVWASSLLIVLPLLVWEEKRWSWPESEDGQAGLGGLEKTAGVEQPLRRVDWKWTRTVVIRRTVLASPGNLLGMQFHNPYFRSIEWGTERWGWGELRKSSRVSDVHWSLQVTGWVFTVWLRVTPIALNVKNIKSETSQSMHLRLFSNCNQAFFFNSMD